MAIPEILKLRQKYPEYNDIDDVTIADRLAAKFPDAYGDLPAKVRGTPMSYDEKAKAYGEIKTPEPWYTQAIEPVAEGVGMIGGGLLGAASPIPGGAVIGAGMGYAGMKNAARLVRELFGLDKPRGVSRTTTDIISDVGTGGLMEVGGQVAGKTVAKAATEIKQIIKGPFGQYLSTPAGKERLRLFDEFGIKPSPADIMPDSKTLSIVESVLGYRPVSGDVMLRRATEKVDALNKARLALIGKKAPDQTIEGLGMQIRKEAEQMLSKYAEGNQAKLNSMVDDLVSQMGITGKHEAGARFSTVMEGARVKANKEVEQAYQKYSSSLPEGGNDVIPLDNTFKIATDLMKEESASAIPNKKVTNILKNLGGGAKAELPEGVTPEMLEKFPQIREAIDEVTQPNMTWLGLKKTRTQLLDRVREIKRSTGGNTEESRAYSMLADAIDRDMETFAQKQGGDLWTNYQTARDLSRRYHDIYDKDILKIMNANPEDIVKKIVKNGEVTLFRQIQQAGGNDAVIPLRQATFKEMLEQSTANDILSTKKLASKMKMLGETLDELVTPEQKRVLNEITRKGEFFITRQKGMRTIDFLDMLTGTSNERIVNAILQPNNAQNVKLAKRLLSQERMDDVTSFAIEKVLKMSGTGNYLPVTSAKEFTKFVDPLKELLPPARFSKLVDFLKTGQRMEKVEALARNASQTGQVLLGSQIASSLMRKPSIGALTSTLGIPYMIAKIYTSDAAVKYFTKAIAVSPYSGEAVKNFSRALGIVFTDVVGNELKEQQ